MCRELVPRGGEGEVTPQVGGLKTLKPEQHLETWTELYMPPLLTISLFCSVVSAWSVTASTPLKDISFGLFLVLLHKKNGNTVR